MSAESLTNGAGAPKSGCEASLVDLVGAGKRSLEWLCSKLFCFVIGRERGEGVWQGTIVLTDDVHLQRLHLQHMQIGLPTDVMTFPYDPGEMGTHGGDIVISVDTAAQQAHDAGWGVVNEILFLVTHGTLHLLGWSDQSKVEQSRMLERQHQLLEEFWQSSAHVSTS